MEKYEAFRATTPKELVMKVNEWRQDKGATVEILRELLSGSPFGIEMVLVYREVDNG